MIGRTSGSAEVLHLLNEERQQCTLVLDSGLGHRVEVCLVGRTATLGYHHKAIFVALHSLDVYLCRQIATSVHLVIHVERSILRIAQVVLCICVIHSERESFLVLEICPNALSLLSVDDCRTSVLAEGQNTLASCFGIAQELQCYILVVL